MRDDDRLLNEPNPEFGSGVIGVCDICGERQAVIVLHKERYRLCVLDFLNKTWIKSEKRPSAPPAVYRSERIFFPTDSAPGGKAPAIVLSPTKPIRHPVVLVTPDVFGITTTLLDAAIRFAREGFEVLVPDLGKTDGVGPSLHLTLRAGKAMRGGVPVPASKVANLVALYRDALRALMGRDMVDPKKVGVFGASYGGSLALAVAAQSTDVSAVALAYPVPVTPPTLPGLVTAPVLLVRGARDATAEKAERQLRASSAGPAATFVTVPDVRHGFLSRDLSAYDLVGAETAWAQIVAFLKGRLMPPMPTPPPPPSRPDPAAPAAPAAPRPPTAAVPTAPAR